MKKKMALFLLTLGMGMGASMTYASEDNWLECKVFCYNEYKYCLEQGTPQALCASERLSCVPRCMEN